MASLLHHLRHWFTPHTSNNYRAHLLKNSSLVLIVALVIGSNALIRIIEATPFHILGFSTSVTIDEVVTATNQERLVSGLRPLRYSEVLADAARRKAAHMFAEDYWAHNSPSGKTPWVWFNEVGYRYTFAGENLAKDFGDTQRMFSAWMNSPTHKANIVNDKYQEIGVAVVPGVLSGSETVLVVQLFGATGNNPGVVSGASEPDEVASLSPASPEILEVKELGMPVEDTLPPSLGKSPFSFGVIDEYLVKKTIGVSIAVLFLLALIIDLIIAENNILSRRVGKNWGHIIVINVILFLVTIAHAGSIR